MVDDVRDKPNPEVIPDPVFLHARREAVVIVVLFGLFFVWSLLVSRFLGYTPPPEDGLVVTVWGMPRWIFWGIFAPWIVVNLVTIWFCYFYMKNDDLGKDEP